MFLEESLWIKSKLEHINLKKNDKVLDIGSSSLKYRTIEQPYIDKNIFSVLRKIGCEIIHLDCKDKEGVDIVCDIAKLDTLQNQYDLILCTNLLEHIQDRMKFIEDVNRLLKDSGYLIVTVPYNFEYHPDPVDTMYRPSVKEIEQAFYPLHVIDFKLVDTPSALCHLDIVSRITSIFRRKKHKVSCVLFKNG